MNEIAVWVPGLSQEKYHSLEEWVVSTISLFGTNNGTEIALRAILSLAGDNHGSAN